MQATRIEQFRQRGLKLQEFRRETSRRCQLETGGKCGSSTNDILEEIASGIHEDEYKQSSENPAELLLKPELESLWNEVALPKTTRHYSNCPMSLQLGFVLLSISRRPFGPVRKFIRRPSASTLHKRFCPTISEAVNPCSCLDLIDHSIQTSIETCQLPPASFVALSTDAIALTAHQRYLPAKASEYAFVFYAQPFDRRFWYFPLPVLPHSADRVREPIQRVMQLVADSMT
jgi:hypothetical protein